MLLLLPTIGACSVTEKFVAQERRVASGAVLVPPPAERPALIPGEDLGARARKGFAYGDENALRLVIGRCNTDDQSVQLATAGKLKRSALPECVELRKSQEKKP